MRLLDFIFALRPLVLVPAWSFFILGHWLARDRSSEDSAALRFVLFTLVLVGTYLINQIADFESDRLNEKGFFLQRGIFSRRAYAAVAAVCMVSGLALSWARDAVPLALTAAAALGLAYSLPPVRLAARAGLDLLANAAGYGVLAVILGAGDEAFEPVAAIPAATAAALVCCALAVGAVFLHTTLLDLEGDRRTGKRTVGVVLGPERARRLAALLAPAAVAAAGAGQEPLLLFASTGTTMLAVAAALVPHRVSSRAVCVGGTALFALAAGIHIPWFVAGLLVLVVVTRLYYKHRFSLRYPAL